MPIRLDPYPRSVLPDDHWDALYRTNELLVDAVLDDLTELARGTPFAELQIAAYLPPKELPRYTAAFLRKFLVCLVSVGLKLRLPAFVPLGCTAEELAVVAMKIRAAQLLHETGRAANFDAWDEAALEDVDCELLYEPALDGIEDSDEARWLALGHLRFQESFRPFQPPRVMHLYADDGDQPAWQADRAHWHSPAVDENDLG
jgi:hypothetical protein